jgi:hypothetical protein
VWFALWELMRVVRAFVQRPKNEISLSQNPSLTSQEVSGTYSYAVPILTVGRGVCGHRSRSQRPGHGREGPPRKRGGRMGPRRWGARDSPGAVAGTDGTGHGREVGSPPRRREECPLTPKKRQGPPSFSQRCGSRAQYPGYGVARTGCCAISPGLLMLPEQRKSGREPPTPLDGSLYSRGVYLV